MSEMIARNNIMKHTEQTGRRSLGQRFTDLMKYTVDWYGDLARRTIYRSTYTA